VLAGASLTGLLALAAIGCGGGSSGPDVPKGANRIAAVIKGLDNPFFRTMNEGLVAAGRREGVTVRVSAAVDDQDTAGQASALESFVEQRPGCYVVNPITPTGLVPSLAHVPRGTPVVNLDSRIDSTAARAAGVTLDTYIGTDNVAASRLAAAAMARFAGQGGRVAVIAGPSGDPSSIARVRGFRLGARGRLTIAHVIAADYDRGRAELAGESLLRARPRIRGIFAINDVMALGIVRAVRAAGLRGKVAVIGFDGTRQALDAVQSGALSATVAQYPYAIGQLGVEACVAAMRGKRLPATVDAPAQLITRANVTRARDRFPHPVEPFRDPLATLLGR
jgi:ABC-type sugar transport system substrate-binding protein